MIYIGIDPGRSGAIAVLGERGSKLWLADLCLPFREMKLVVRDQLWYRETYDHVLAAIEVQHAFPGMRVSATWALAEHYTFARLLLEVLGIGYARVTPAKWQRAMLGKLPKDRAARKRVIGERAGQRWPDAELRGPRGRLLDGRSDALWIAEWARINLGKEAETPEDGQG